MLSKFKKGAMIVLTTGLTVAVLFALVRRAPPNVRALFQA